MKILQVIPFFVPSWGFGGPVRVCYDISKRLVKSGYKVTVLTTDAYDQTKRIERVQEEMDGISVFRFRNISNYLAKAYNIYLPRGFAEYFSKNVENYDVVHLHAFFTYQNIVSSKICLKKNIPYILHLHESPIPKAILGKVLIKKIFNFLFGHKILNGATKIFALTTAEREDLITSFPNLEDKIEVIPNGIEITSRRNKANKEELRKKYGFKADDKIFLSLSRLAKIKRIDLIVQAFSKICERDNQAKLLIVGPDEGNTQIGLEKLCQDLGIEKNVKFTGPVEGDKKEDMYNLSDVYILMSEYESFSITCLEALEHDLPVFLSENVGLVREIEKFNCGTVLSFPNDAIKTAKQLVDGYSKKEELAKNCQTALKQFDIEKTTEKILGIYKNIKEAR
jgi:glycosyltransferase involved in cell wall biosynthesis